MHHTLAVTRTQRIVISMDLNKNLEQQCLQQLASTCVVQMASNTLDFNISVAFAEIMLELMELH
jgi:GTP-sensing pleiotropic transcriptional regulator CodY